MNIAPCTVGGHFPTPALGTIFIAPSGVITKITSIIVVLVTGTGTINLGYNGKGSGDTYIDIFPRSFPMSASTNKSAQESDVIILYPKDLIQASMSAGMDATYLISAVVLG